MNQIVRFPARPPAYPTTSKALNTAECTFLIAIRWWVDDYRNGTDPLPRLCIALRIAGSEDAAFSIDRLMAAVARGVRRRIAVHCPRCPQLSADEKHLLYAANLTQAGDASLAERCLRATLLSASGAECALGPLEKLAELFAEARLLFGRRRSPMDDDTPINLVESWAPAVSDRTIH